MASALQVDGSNNDSTITMPELEAATVREIVQSLFPWASPTRAQLARSLWAVGSVTLVMGMTTAFHMPLAGPIFGRYKPAVYSFIVVVILAVAAVEMATAFFLPRSNMPRFQAFAERLLPFAYLVLLIAVSASGLAIPYKL